MSPISFSGSTADVSLAGTASLECAGGVNCSYGLRPAISLVSDIEISGGSGTSEDPYVVK